MINVTGSRWCSFFLFLFLNLTIVDDFLSAPMIWNKKFSFLGQLCIVTVRSIVSLVILLSLFDVVIPFSCLHPMMHVVPVRSLKVLEEYE